MLGGGRAALTMQDPRRARAFLWRGPLPPEGRAASSGQEAGPPGSGSCSGIERPATGRQTDILWRSVRSWAWCRWSRFWLPVSFCRSLVSVLNALVIDSGLNMEHLWAHLVKGGLGLGWTFDLAHLSTSRINEVAHRRGAIGSVEAHLI